MRNFQFLLYILLYCLNWFTCVCIVSLSIKKRGHIINIKKWMLFIWEVFPNFLRPEYGLPSLINLQMSHMYCSDIHLASQAQAVSLALNGATFSTGKLTYGPHYPEHTNFLQRVLLLEVWDSKPLLLIPEGVGPLLACAGNMAGRWRWDGIPFACGHIAMIPNAAEWPMMLYIRNPKDFKS